MNNLTFLNYFVCLPIALAFISYSYYLISIKHVLYEYIDEIFHIPQAQKYCSGQFSYWDPKITTPPGLYVLAYLFERFLSLFVSNSDLICNFQSLRLLNLIGGSFFLPLLTFIPIVNDTPQKYLIGSMILCPLITIYFNLFYTDIWSTVFIMASFSICFLTKKKNFHLSSFVSSIFVFLSLWFRQTNIVWSLFNFTILMNNKIKCEKGKGYNFRHFKSRYPQIYKVIFEAFPTNSVIRDNILRISIFIDYCWLNPGMIFPFLSNIIFFTGFLIYNGGVTFGDKENHVSTIHMSQLYYCSLFMMLFGWPLFLNTNTFKKYLKFIFGKPINVGFTLASYLVLFLTIKKFTTVHPFLLADNRHYTFYIWKKIISPNRYFLIPLYHFVITVLIQKLAIRNNICIIVAYIVCTAISIVPSPLFEPRYYILPFLYWRMLVSYENDEQLIPKEPKDMGKVIRLVVEFLWNLFVNIAMLYVFINYEFYWESDPSVIQRIIW